jgi:hypothetical protein
MVDSEDRQSPPVAPQPVSPSLWDEPARKRRPGRALLITVIVIAVVALCLGGYVAATFIASHAAQQIPSR